MGHAEGLFILAAGALLALGLVASLAAGRLRIPGLVLFLGVGMALGSDGLGLIEFDDYELARTIGIIALALILFEGGLAAGLPEIRPVLGSALSLALLGTLLSAVLAGGAFAAFLSTASGLTISVAGVIDQDLLGPRLHRMSGGDVPRIQTFRLAAVVAVILPYAASWLTPNVSLADTVGLAFAVAASTFCPLLILGVWWRRLSVPGAAAGLLTGGVLALGATTITVLGGVSSTGHGWLGALLAQPAAWTMPTAFLVAIVVSLATPSRIPAGTSRTMVRLHAPEAVSGSATTP